MHVVNEHIICLLTAVNACACVAERPVGIPMQRSVQLRQRPCLTVSCVAVCPQSCVGCVPAHLPGEAPTQRRGHGGQDQSPLAARHLGLHAAHLPGGTRTIAAFRTQGFCCSYGRLSGHKNIPCKHVKLLWVTVCMKVSVFFPAPGLLRGINTS